jgi:hypothetical protein
MIYADSRALVEQARVRFTKKWRLRRPAVVECLQEAGDDLFTFLSFPHALAVTAHPQRDEDRHPLTSLADADLRIPAVHDQVLNLVLREIAATPRLEIPSEPADQPRHGVLRQRSPTQQGRQRAFVSPLM